MNRPIDGVDLDGLEWSSTNDQTGFIKNASENIRDNDPVKAFFIDVSAIAFNWLSPLGVIDEAIVVWSNPSSTKVEKLQSTVDAAMGTPLKVDHVETSHVDNLKMEVPKSEPKKFNGKQDTKSGSSNEALRNAKDQNGSFYYFFNLYSV